MSSLLDLRTIAPAARHPAIFSLFQTLPPGESFDLLNDHEPAPLKQQFNSLWPNQFDWQAIESGPAQWRVRITRRAASSSCCGCCGGGH